jgi:ribonuclease G
VSTVIYANVTPYETRVAVREDGALVELLIERNRERSVVGSLFKGRISRVLPGMQAAFVDVGLERDAFLYVDDVAEALEDEEIEPGEFATTPPIQDLLREGQEILVQITRELGSSKGPRATSHITIPGRYLVLMPGNSHVGVSRRITDQTERERLRALLSEIPHSGGVIVRTAGEGRERADFLADLAVLESMWRHITKRVGEVSAPCLVHRDLDLVLRAARDLAGPQLAELWIDDTEGYQRVVEFLDRVQPELTGKVKLYRRQLDIFEAFGVEAELEQALQPKVWLRSGGSLVIDQTEALVAIDVNTGRYVGGADLEDTVFRINVEAAHEVAWTSSTWRTRVTVRPCWRTSSGHSRETGPARSRGRSDPSGWYSSPASAPNAPSSAPSPSRARPVRAWAASSRRRRCVWRSGAPSSERRHRARSTSSPSAPTLRSSTSSPPSCAASSLS